MNQKMKPVLSPDNIRKVWREACDHGVLSEAAFRKGARQIEQMVLARMAAGADKPKEAK